MAAHATPACASGPGLTAHACPCREEQRGARVARVNTATTWAHVDVGPRRYVSVDLVQSYDADHSAAMSAPNDWYAILGIEPTATTSEIRTAYRKQALKSHPDRAVGDKDDATARFKLVAEYVAF